jgi:hypothetical protein
LLKDLGGESKDASRRRLVLAAALACALIEITATLIPTHSYTLETQPNEIITIAKLTRIEHRPKPTPKPTPMPIVHTKVVAQTHAKPTVVNPGKPAVKQRIKRISQAAPKTRTLHHAKPVEHIVTGAQGAGTAKKAAALSGSLGTGGTGSGQSGEGQGTGGAPLAHEPCGYVDFSPTGQARTDPATGRVWEYIAVIVHYPDGSEQSVDLDYPFYYASSADDPFLQGHSNIPATFQFPPPSQAASEPDVVQYVMQHTDAQGFTKLRDCPR